MASVRYFPSCWPPTLFACPIASLAAGIDHKPWQRSLRISQSAKAADEPSSFIRGTLSYLGERKSPKRAAVTLQIFVPRSGHPDRLHFLKKTGQHFHSFVFLVCDNQLICLRELGYFENLCGKLLADFCDGLLDLLR